MSDTTITKIDSRYSPRGAAGQRYLACGVSMSMRLWENETADKEESDTKRDYETIGYVIKGKAELHIEGQVVLLCAGNSWVVPKGASHHYKILEEFSAVETTSPPAELHDRGASEKAPGPREYIEAGKEDAVLQNKVEPAKELKAEEERKNMQNKKEDGNKQGDKSKSGDDANREMKNKQVEKAEDAVKAQKAEKNDDKQGEVCDPQTGECTSEQEERKQGEEADAESGGEKQESDNKTAQAQKIVAQIPRTDSEPTSNSEPKEAKPAEHVDVAGGDKAEKAEKAQNSEGPEPEKEETAEKQAPAKTDDNEEKPKDEA